VTSPRPRCSVIIPAHNKAALTKQCLESILRSSPVTSFELIVVDDGSTDSTRAILASLGSRVRSVHLPANVGFASACNAGAEAAASSEFLLFLNNDTIASEGWLDASTRYADGNPDAAVVGSKLLFPDGTIQHAGVVFNLAGDPLHIYAGCAADHPAVDRSRTFQAVTAACFLVRRAEFDRLNGFDTVYENDLEDVDFCLRLGQSGRQIHYCHKSVLVHLESASRGRPTGRGRSARIYRERWGGRVRSDELNYYLEDGLLDMLRVPPDKLAVGRERREVADVLQVRSRQLLELLRETVKATTFSAPDQTDEERVERAITNSAERGGLPLKRFSRLERRIQSLRDELSSPVSALGNKVAVGDHASGALSGDSAHATGGSAYDRVLRDLPDFVARETGAGSTILVVSKGDDRLLRIPGRAGWHFPRAADGRYAGYYPQDSEEAVAHLERLRHQGADYIVFPETSMWWLDHYTGLKRHLAEYGAGRADAAGVVFDVRNGPVAIDREPTLHNSSRTDGPGGPDFGKGPVLAGESLRPVALIVEGLLPRDATLAVTTTHSNALYGLAPERTTVVALEDDDAGILAAVEERAIAGTDFLVVPYHVFGWLAERPSIAAELRARYSLVTRQAYFCEIYDLRRDMRQAGRTVRSE